MVHMRRKEYREAMPDLLKTFQHVATYPGLVPNMLYAEMELGLCDEVIRNATAALQLDTAAADIMNIRAYCLLRAGRHQEALVDITRSLAIRQDYGEVWYLRGWAAHQEGDSVACCESLAKSLPLSMTDDDARIERDRLFGQQCR